MEDVEKLKNRIVGSGQVAVQDLVENPKNWRFHPDDQADVVEDLVSEVGWVKSILVNKRTGNMIDGHLRVQIAKKRKEKSVPVEYVDLSADEEDLVLASLDHSSTLAEKDEKKLSALLANLKAPEGEKLSTMLDDLAETVATKRGSEKEKPEVEFAEELLEEHNFVVLYFDNSVDWVNLLSILELPTVQASHSKKGFEVRGVGRVVKGAEALEKLRKWGRENAD